MTQAYYYYISYCTGQATILVKASRHAVLSPRLSHFWRDEKQGVSCCLFRWRVVVVTTRFGGRGLGFTLIFAAARQELINKDVGIEATWAQGEGLQTISLLGDTYFLTPLMERDDPRQHIWLGCRPRNLGVWRGSNLRRPISRLYEKATIAF